MGVIAGCVHGWESIVLATSVVDMKGIFITKHIPTDSGAVQAPTIGKKQTMRQRSLRS